MNSYAIPIEVISHTDKEGNIRPYRIRAEGPSGEFIVYNVHNILSVDLMRIVGNKTLKFICEISYEDLLRKCEIHYEMETCTWMLFKLL